MTKTHGGAFSRWFVTEDGAPRARRASDVIALVAGLLVVVVTVLVHADETTTAARQPLPEWLATVLEFVYGIGLAYAVGLLLALLLGGRARRRALRDVAIAALLAIVLGLGVMSVFGTLWPHAFPTFSGGPVRVDFPEVRVALITAVLAAAAPHLARPVRLLGWIVVALAGVAAWGLDYADVAGTWGGVGVGFVAASAVLLAFGSPRGYPDLDDVAVGLARIGLPVHDLHVDPDQSWGVRRLLAADHDGRVVEVKAYGRDATDSQLMGRAWHALAYRGGGGGVALSRLQAVEHEALVSLLAARAGVCVPDVLAAGRASDAVAILAVTRCGRPLAEIESGAVDDAQLVRVWQDVGRLHAAGMSHGSLDAFAVLVEGDSHTITDLAAASVVPSHAGAHLDVVQLLASTAGVVGTERAVSAAAEGLGPAALAAALPYLQVPALGSRTRHQLDKSKATLGELRKAIGDLTGVEPPPPVKLRRLGLRDLLMLVVLGLFVSAIIPVLLGVDYASLWAELQNATWSWVLLGAVAASTVFVSQAFSLMAAVGRTMPLRPTTVLEVAMTFISFAVPGVTGRVALNAAYLHRFGVSPAVSVTQGAIDGFTGFLVQAALLLLAFATGAVSLTSLLQGAGVTPGSEDVPWGKVLLVAAALVAIVVITVLRVRRLRDRIVPVVSSSWSALRELFRSPSRAFALLGANLVTQVLLGLVLWFCLLALDTKIGLMSALVAVVATSLLQGLIPVPGGIGVSEAVMTAVLVPMGVPSDVAMAATILWRALTFYLPATGGFVAMRWLQGHEYL